MEVAVDECVSGKEVLRLLAGLEALHLSFSSACGSMRVLSTIVEVATLSVLDIGQQMTLRHPIASQLVGDDHSRHILQALQQTPEEPLGSFPITSLLDQNIEDDTVLIHGTPKIMLNAQDPDEHLVEVPLVARSGTAAAQTTGKVPAEFLAPAPHRLVGDDDAALSQKQLNIAQAEAEHMIQPYSMDDDLRGEAMAVVWVRWRLHADSLVRSRHGRQPWLP
jgi:hypothetical protein